MKKFLSIFLCGAIILSLSGCGSMNKATQGGLIGAGSGAAIGAALGYIISGNATGLAIGAAAGTAAGGTAGALIGNKMDKKAAELAAQMENAKVETVEINGLEAIRVTFDSGILFPVNGSSLSAESKASLSKFTSTMADLPQTDITVWGHTDNTGSAAVNEKLSQKRADNVSAYLTQCGMSKDRITSEGKSFNLPVAGNDTAEGRAQNRRVEIFVTANEAMIAAAQNGTLK